MIGPVLILYFCTMLVSSKCAICALVSLTHYYCLHKKHTDSFSKNQENKTKQKMRTISKKTMFDFLDFYKLVGGLNDVFIDMGRVYMRRSKIIRFTGFEIKIFLRKLNFLFENKKYIFLTFLIPNFSLFAWQISSNVQISSHRSKSIYIKENILKKASDLIRYVDFSQPYKTPTGVRPAHFGNKLTIKNHDWTLFSIFQSLFLMVRSQWP